MRYLDEKWIVEDAIEAGVEAPDLGKRGRYYKFGRRPIVLARALKRERARAAQKIPLVALRKWYRPQDLRSTQPDGVPDWYYVAKDSLDAGLDCNLTPDLGKHGRYFRGGDHGTKIMQALERSKRQ